MHSVYSRDSSYPKHSLSYMLYWIKSTGYKPMLRVTNVPPLISDREFGIKKRNIRDCEIGIYNQSTRAARSIELCVRQHTVTSVLNSS